MIAFSIRLRRMAALAGASLVIALGGVPAATQAAQVYSLKQLVVGSIIPKAVVQSAIPFDKRYEELSPEQRDILRADYESLAPDDETPFPANGLKPLAEPLARLALKSGFQGALVAGVDVDSTGKAKAVTIFKTPSVDFKDAVTNALLASDYRPARCKGQPCAQTYMLRLDFQQP